MDSKAEYMPEQNKDFKNVAEEVAMRKVVDIHQRKFQKHSFVRYGPLVTESGTGRFKDNEGITNPTIDRLDNIFRYGLIARSFAERSGFELSSNWSDPINKTKISLGRARQSLEESFKIGTRAGLHDQPIKIPRENVYTLLIENKYPPVRLFDAAADNRIASRFFKGIVFVDGSGEEISPVLSERIDFSSANTEETVNTIVQKMLSVYKNRPYLCLPVYGLSGKLYWPKELDYNEVQRLVEENH